MKNWINKKYTKRVIGLRLKQVVYDAWDAVPEDYIQRITRSVTGRLQRVKEAKGGGQGTNVEDFFCRWRSLFVLFPVRNTL